IVSARAQPDALPTTEARFLVNDVCVREGIPWVYGACVGAYGLALLVRPHVSPCLRCVLEEMPAPGSGPTCDTAGVVAPIVHVVRSEEHKSELQSRVE